MTASVTGGGSNPPCGRVLIETSVPSPSVADRIVRLKSRIIGQPRAVDAVGQGMEIDEAGLLKIGALAMKFLFTGPPGVGKTQLAYEFAKVWIGELLRDRHGSLIEPITLIDCTQYSDSHDVANLKGSTKGYVGYEDETPLAQHRIDRYAIEVLLHEAEELFLQEKMLRNPAIKRPRVTPGERSRLLETRVMPDKPFKKVLLFDEVGRAHRNLWNILITLLNGKPFEFGDGTKAEFARAALFMSDNTNEKEIRDILKGGMGFRRDWNEVDPDKLHDVIYRQTLRRIETVFPPAFVSRIRKNIVVFRPLGPDDWRRILDLRLSEIAELFERSVGRSLGKIEIAYSEDCKQFLLEKGIDRLYGARPLEQELEKQVITRIARAVNRGDVRPGERLVFERERKPKDRLEVYVER